MAVAVNGTLLHTTADVFFLVKWWFKSCNWKALVVKSFYWKAVVVKKVKGSGNSWNKTAQTREISSIFFDFRSDSKSRKFPGISRLFPGKFPDSRISFSR